MLTFVSKQPTVKAFFNAHQDLYYKELPPVYDNSEIPEIQIIEDTFHIIKSELDEVLSNPIKKEKAFNKRRYAKSPNWKQMELMIYGLKYQEKIQLFPKTYAILNQLEGVSTIYFSFLNKNSDIKSHNGDTDAFYRIHLGLKVPGKYPDCGMEVAGLPLSWKEGKCFAFNDIYFHSSWNHTNQERIVLIIDLLRPEFRNQYKKINAGVIATLIQSRVYPVFGIFIELLPRILTRTILPIIHFFVYQFYRFKIK